MPALTVAEIARLCEGTAEGDQSRIIRGANTLELAGEDEVCFAEPTPKAESKAARSSAGCLIVALSFAAAGERSIIRVAGPRAAFARVLASLYATPPLLPAIHPSAVIAESARVAKDCHIGAYVVIGSNAEIASGCVIGNGAHIGDRVRIGQQTIVHSHVTLYNGVEIGSRVLLHAGCVIGADGFGFVRARDHYQKFPQVGKVVIEDDVEIGANSCVDRAALGVTRIGSGSKLDNLVHIGHNCNIGRHVVIAAQTGFAGGVTVDDYAVIGGQVGAGEKAKIEANAMVGSKSGVLSFQKVSADEPVWGIPARPLKEHLKGLANVRKISGMRDDLKQLQRRVEALEVSE